MMAEEYNDWRTPNDYEQAIIDLLLSEKFRGAEAIRDQLTDFDVRTISGFGSFSIRTKSKARADVVHRIPVEASAIDLDGNGIHYLLHVIDGIVIELEVFSETTDVPLSRPIPESMTLKINNHS